MKTRLVDWSRWQGNLAPGLLPPIGIDGVWLKANGATATATAPADPFHVDPYFVPNAKAVDVWNHEHADMTLLKGAFCYLVHGYAEAQAALFHNLLRMVGGPEGFAIKLDVEDPGITDTDLLDWLYAWNALTKNALTTPSYPFLIYTQRSKWVDQFHLGDVTRFTPHLEEAHWVDSSYRTMDSAPKEQERGIYPDWWDVDYAGIRSAFGLQYTNSVKVGSVRTTGSLYWCRRAEFSNLLIR